MPFALQNTIRASTDAVAENIGTALAGGEMPLCPISAEKTRTALFVGVLASMRGLTFGTTAATSSPGTRPAHQRLSSGLLPIFEQRCIKCGLWTGTGADILLRMEEKRSGDVYRIAVTKCGTAPDLWEWELLRNDRPLAARMRDGPFTNTSLI
jgi:hypothetical protein